MQNKKSKENNKQQEIDNKGITVKKQENMPEWYSEVVQKAELADYSTIQGFMVIRPNAYSIWEKIQEYFNNRLEKMQVKNSYFPLLIPESFFKREAEHAQGFAPELAYIQKKEDGERFAIRPTSETIMYDSYSKWIRSWRDLPLRLNQWCNVLRWEVKQTKPFLRTREFLWQEGHNVFETEKEAVEDMMMVIKEYKKLCEEQLAIPVLVGRKSQAEKFPGAITTMTTEALMPDGKALQCGTTHNLGQGFAKVFNIKYLDKNEKQSYPFQTSWGFSTRLIGAVIMTHGDDKGFVLPPKIAKNKAVIVPILIGSEKDKEKVLKKCLEVEKKLSKFGVFVDSREEYNPGWKFNEWELKGIPLRIEIGPKDLEKKQITIVRRDTGKKDFIKEKDISINVGKILEDIQKSLFEKAKKFLDSQIDSASSLAELKTKISQGKIVKAYFTESERVEGEIRDSVGVNSRFVEDVKKPGKCIITGKPVNTLGYFAKNY